jgi:hypothetical protein
MWVPAAAGKWGFRRRSTTWRAAVWILLLSFTLQSFITQTHIHTPTQNVSAAKSVLGHGGIPTDREPSNCPFCQAMASAGVFFTPAAPALFLPITWAEVAPPATQVSFEHRAITHGWQSRAPPQR